VCDTPVITNPSHQLVNSLARNPHSHCSTFSGSRRKVKYVNSIIGWISWPRTLFRKLGKRAKWEESCPESIGYDSGIHRILVRTIQWNPVTWFECIRGTSLCASYRICCAALWTELRSKWKYFALCSTLLKSEVCGLLIVAACEYL